MFKKRTVFNFYSGNYEINVSRINKCFKKIRMYSNGWNDNEVIKNIRNFPLSASRIAVRPAAI